MKSNPNLAIEQPWMECSREQYLAVIKASLELSESEAIKLGQHPFPHIRLWQILQNTGQFAFCQGADSVRRPIKEALQLWRT